MKSQKVKDVTAYWTTPPPEHSERCKEWVELIKNGWKPNRRIKTFGYHEAAAFYGVWIWEYVEVVSPLLHELGAYE